MGSKVSLGMVVKVRFITLHRSIFQQAIGLVLLVSITVLASVWWTTYEQVQTRMSKDILLAEDMLSELLTKREAMLYTSISLLGDDFRFKKAVATADKPRVSDAIANHQEKLNADLLMIFDLQGVSLALEDNKKVGDSLSSETKILSETKIEQVTRNGGLSDFILLGGKLYQTFMLRIDAPTPIAIGIIGFEISPAFVSQISRSSQLDISINVYDLNNSSDSQSQHPYQLTLRDKTSTKQSLEHSDKSTLHVKELNWHRLVFYSNLYLTDNFTLYKSGDLLIEVELEQALHTLIAEFSSLKTDISIVAACAIVIAFFITFGYSRKLSKPMSHLSDVAKAITSGDYGNKIDVKTNSKECTHLADALGDMQNTIKMREKDIVWQAQHDALTKLHTRHHVSALLEQWISSGEPFQVVCINVKGLSKINNVFGFEFGDHCLIEIAKRLSILEGLKARFSGGEFLLAFKGHTSIYYLESLKHSIEQTITQNDITCNIQTTLGVVCCPDHAQNADELCKNISIVLSEAKSKRSSLLLFERPFEARYARRLSIVSQLRSNLSKKGIHFALNYQAKFNLISQELDSVEALIRWIDPVLGYVPPDEFIHIAEQAGLIEQVTKWVVAQAVRDIKTMRKHDIDVKCAINLSASDLENDSLLPYILRCVENALLPSSSVSFDITESDLVKDTQAAISNLKEFKQAGFTLALDSFGSGYTSLPYLNTFPGDFLNIDKDLVLNLATNQNDKNLVITIVKLAKQFGLKVVAKGVEDEQSLNILAACGCECAQGYFISRPIPLEQFIKWAHEKQRSARQPVH